MRAAAEGQSGVSATSFEATRLTVVERRPEALELALLAVRAQHPGQQVDLGDRHRGHVAEAHDPERLDGPAEVDERAGGSSWTATRPFQRTFSNSAQET